MIKFFAFLTWWILAGTGTFDHDWYCSTELEWRDGVGYGYVCEYRPGYRNNAPATPEVQPEPEPAVPPKAHRPTPLRSRKYGDD